jgi:hypothetical protein
LRLQVRAAWLALPHGPGTATALRACMLSRHGDRRQLVVTFFWGGGGGVAYLSVDLGHR